MDVRLVSIILLFYILFMFNHEDNWRRSENYITGNTRTHVRARVGVSVWVSMRMCLRDM